jgi:topoisomerase-4 subunit A
VFPLAELRFQPKGGRGLTLMALEEGEALAAFVTFGDALRVQGAGRGGKARDEVLKGAALALHRGKRARKGVKVAAVLKPESLGPA